MANNTYRYNGLYKLNFQKFYCHYCGMGYTKKIGMGKPPGNMTCRIETNKRKVTTFHRWVYGEKY